MAISSASLAVATPVAFTQADLAALLNAGQGPCVSIHLPTTPYPDQADQNRIRYKNALARVMASLERDHAQADHDALLAPLHDLLDDRDLFSGLPSGGLAIFRDADRCDIGLVPEGCPEFAVVADTFHVKPLVRVLADLRPFRLLCISEGDVALYEGNRLGLKPVDLHPDVPTTMAQALGQPDHVAKTKRAKHTPEDSDQRDSQLRRYFQRVDHAITRHHAAPDGTNPPAVPMLLAATADHQSRYREVADNPHLINGASRITRDPFHNIDDDELARLALRAIEHGYRQRADAFVTKYHDAAAHQTASGDLREVARAAAFGIVDTLAIQRDLRLGGRLDRESGDFTEQPLDDPATDDLYDDIAEAVLSADGRVLVLEEDQMPEGLGLAALFRYPPHGTVERST